MHTTPGNIHATCAIVGADRFLRNEALAGLLEKLRADADAFEPARFSGGEIDLATVLDEVRTPSLLGGRRIAIVDDADPFIKSHRAALEKYCTAPADGGMLILLCNTLPKNTRLHGIIHRNGSVDTLDIPKGRAVVGWAVSWARSRYEKQLSQPAATMLTEHVGVSLGAIDAELSKLATFVGTRTQIAPADIDALTGRHREEKVFAVTDAISSGDPAGALRHWEQVLATDRAAPGRAIAGLAWGVRRLLEARRAWEGGTKLAALARSMYTDPAVLRRRLERVTTQQLEQQQGDLLAVDLAVKTGAATVDVAVETFIVKHAAMNQG